MLGLWFWGLLKLHGLLSWDWAISRQFSMDVLAKYSGKYLSGARSIVFIVLPYRGANLLLRGPGLWFEDY